VAINLQGHASSISSLEWSPDGLLASGAEDKNIIIWDLAAEQPAQILKGHTRGIRTIAWGPQGYLASLSSDEIIIWEIQTGKQLQAMQSDYSYSIDYIAWSSDGRLAFQQSINYYFMDVLTGESRQFQEQDHTTSIAWSWDHASISSVTGDDVTVLSRSQDGKLASGTGNGDIIIRDMNTEESSVISRAHNGSILDITWLLNGRLVSVGEDFRVVLWDLQTKQPVYQIDRIPGRKVTSSPDGKFVAWSENDRIQVMPVRYMQPICKLVIRNFSEDEWKKYRGRFYVYHPTCPDLAIPEIQDPLLTINGRLAIIGKIIAGLGAIVMIIWLLKKAVKLKTRK